MCKLSWWRSKPKVIRGNVEGLHYIPCVFLVVVAPTADLHIHFTAVIAFEMVIPGKHVENCRRLKLRYVPNSKEIRSVPKTLRQYDLGAGPVTLFTRQQQMQRSRGIDLRVRGIIVMAGPISATHRCANIPLVSAKLKSCRRFHRKDSCTPYGCDGGYQTILLENCRERFPVCILHQQEWRRTQYQGELKTPTTDRDEFL
jgi:hypothetical protein